MVDFGRKWTPFIIGNSFYIKPESFDEKKERINITLGSGRAFGSGEHETTRHCLELMEALSFSSRPKVLDYGTGTGILAIAAAKLNAGLILALDIDFNAISACKNNIQLNHIDQKILLACADLSCISPHIQFDYILANIYADIILKNFLQLDYLLKKGGYILLSGIDWDYIDNVKRSYSEPNYQIVNQKIGNDYNSILYRKVFEN